MQLAEYEQVLPVAVRFLPDLLDHPLVVRLEQVGEAPLELQIRLRRQLLLFQQLHRLDLVEDVVLSWQPSLAVSKPPD